MTTPTGDNQRCERSVLTASDGHRIMVDAWLPAGPPEAVIQIFHGLGEHAARYERFAQHCLEHRYAVIAHSHRGHGEGCAQDDLGHFADDDGWDKVMADALLVQQDVLRRFPGLPIVLLGHSMGSYIAQSFAMRHGDNLAALILSGSTWPDRWQLRMGRLLAGFLAWRSGRRTKSELLNRMSFGDFNKRFAPNRTEFDWLSRDELEVDRYVADPLCGFPASNRLWRDLLSGLLEISTPKALRSIRPSLPILITGGERDPVGGAKSLARLADAYRQTGHGNVTLKVYAEGRHEMLNETNRDEVTLNLLSWIGTNVGQRSPCGAEDSARTVAPALPPRQPLP